MKKSKVLIIAISIVVLLLALNYILMRNQKYMEFFEKRAIASVFEKYLHGWDY
jgi:hypothetical protein